MRTRIAFLFVACSATLCAALPVAGQNALVQKYCAACHTDAARNGGLSLQHYDAAKRNPSLAAMLLSKLENGAMGAAGLGVPDQATQRAWLDATREQATGASEWFVSHEEDILSADIVRTVPPRQRDSNDLPVYRLSLVCHATGSGEIQLTWSPQPQTGRTMTVTADGHPPVEHRIDGHESMGNGAKVQTGHASALLNHGHRGKFELPDRLLTIRELFPGESVEFPFFELNAETRAGLRKCF